MIIRMIALENFKKAQVTMALSSAKDKAYQLRNNLNQDHPILYIYPHREDYFSFDNLLSNLLYLSLVKKKIDLPCWDSGHNSLCAYPNNPDLYLRPLDLSRQFKISFFFSKKSS